PPLPAPPPHPPVPRKKDLAMSYSPAVVHLLAAPFGEELLAFLETRLLLGFGPGKGLVHRDIKPANLFLTGWGSGRLVKVGDFGLAKAFAESGLSGGTRTGDVGGTYEFMCRQQVAYYKDAGPEVDVWSLAASLYYLLTGQTPRDFGA